MKRNSALFYLLCLLATLAQAAAPANKIKVFIFAGQSNMEGKGDFSKLTDGEKAALERTKAHIKFAFNHEPIGPLRPRPGSPATLKKFGVDQMFGPEIFFGLRLAEVWPDQDMIFIKRAVGATSLYGRWNPDWSAEKARLMGEDKVEPLYPDLVAYVKEVLAGYPPDTYEICAMLWVQGEADGNASVRGPKPGSEYGDNLKNLITRVRRDLRVPDLPFIIMQVGAPSVVAGMKAAAKDLPNVTFIPQAPKSDKDAPNFLPQYPAGHYNYEGMKRIGNFMADAYLKNYTKVVRPVSVVAPQRPPDQAVVYKPTPKLDLKMHFYFPPGWSKDDRRPAIVFWCGGGFRSGGATQFLSQAEYFCSRGLVAIHTEYRGTKTEGVSVTDCQEDARSAMRWVKVHAAEYGIDPAKVIAAGGSAGGSLAMLTARPEGPDAPGDDLRISPRPAAMVLFNPAMGETLLAEIGHGGPAQTAFNAQILALSTPPPDQPPAILLYGEKDRAYLDEAKIFLEQMHARGIPCEVWVAGQAGHGFFNQAPWHGAAILRADEFLGSLGYLDGAPTLPVNPDGEMQSVGNH